MKYFAEVFASVYINESDSACELVRGRENHMCQASRIGEDCVAWFLGATHADVDEEGHSRTSFSKLLKTTHIT